MKKEEAKAKKKEERNKQKEKQKEEREKFKEKVKDAKKARNVKYVKCSSNLFLWSNHLTL